MICNIIRNEAFNFDHYYQAIGKDKGVLILKNIIRRS